MTDKNASDMFMTTGAPVYIKVGQALPARQHRPAGRRMVKIACSLMDEGQKEAFERDLELNMAVVRWKGAGRFRVNDVQAARRSRHGDRAIPQRDPLDRGNCSCRWC